MPRKTPNPTDKHVGARIRARRQILGVSQERLAASLGVSFQQVQKYEKGTNRVSASRLQQIAGALDVPVSFFFDGAPGTGKAITLRQGVEPASLVLDFVGTSDGMALVKAFSRVKSKKTRRDIVALVEGIADGGPAMRTK